MYQRDWLPLTVFMFGPRSFLSLGLPPSRSFANCHFVDSGQSRSADIDSGYVSVCRSQLALSRITCLLCSFVPLSPLSLSPLPSLDLPLWIHPCVSRRDPDATPCPICGQLFPMNVIQLHADICASAQEGGPRAQHVTGKGGMLPCLPFPPPTPSSIAFACSTPGLLLST